MWFIYQLWTQFCLENGSLHRGGGAPFAIKRTSLIGWKSFSKWQPLIGGCHLQLKEQFSLAEPSAILEEPFASHLKLETPRRCLGDRPWSILGKKTSRSWLKVNSEACPEHAPRVPFSTSQNYFGMYVSGGESIIHTSANLLYLQRLWWQKKEGAEGAIFGDQFAWPIDLLTYWHGSQNIRNLWDLWPG